MPNVIFILNGFESVAHIKICSVRKTNSQYFST